MYQQIRSAKFVSGLLKHAGDCEKVVTPRAGALPRQMVEIEFKLAGKFFGADHQFLVWAAGSDRDVSGETDGRRHYEAIVVVGVFADQVDASGSAEYPRVIPEELLKSLS